MCHWYVVYTKPLAEETAKLNLERQGYYVYFPRLQYIGRRRQSGRGLVGPLFPRYLFLCLDEGRQSLAPVRSTLGVSAVVRFGVRYAIVPDEIIDNLQLRADSETGLHRLTLQPELVQHTPVKVTEGPFESIEGIFERREGSDRVLILLQLLGQEVRVQVPADMVVPARCAA